MKIHIITIFPESFESYFATSIMKKAINENKIEFFFYKLSNYSKLKTKRVDDKSYWMHGQIISPLPISSAIEDIFYKVWKKIKVIYMSPSWDLLNQEKVELYKTLIWDEFIIICGHYEWIDRRIIDLYVDFEISIWEYVVSSWEISAMVFIDAITRTIPWVLWNSASFEEESFSLKLNRQKEYPQYTRPRLFKWLKVPEVLLSWNHKKIEEWKKNNLK